MVIKMAESEKRTLLLLIIFALGLFCALFYPYVFQEENSSGSMRSTSFKDDDNPRDEIQEKNNGIGLPELNLDEQVEDDEVHHDELLHDVVVPNDVDGMNPSDETDKYSHKNKDENLKWWQSTIIYQIYPRSFQDSDGDGVGDLRGITSRLDYFGYLGVEAIWISPIYKSPMVDFGYDVSDYFAIDPLFGSMEDFEELVTTAHEKGINIIMDFIPNHTSDKHQWFIESSSSRDNKYADYYVWHDGIMVEGIRQPPNNWISVFGGPMWTWLESRQQYYLHQFTKEQPDINPRNPEVLSEIKKIYEFWLEKGVDGFRVDAIRHMFEIEDIFQNEPRSFQLNTTPDQYEYYNHPLTTNQPELMAVIAEWRKLFDEFSSKSGREIFMVVEVLDPDTEAVMSYYGSGANFPFNFNLQFLNASCDGHCYKGLIASWLDNMPDKEWATWTLGSHDVPRISAKIGHDYVDIHNILLLSLPGTPVTYYGEEIGMLAVNYTFEETQDPAGLYWGKERYHLFSRDPSRSPMQWSSGINSGFSDSKATWLPVAPNYEQLNVEVQSKDPSGNSSLQLYQKMARLRRSYTFRFGTLDYAIISKDIFSFVRHVKENPTEHPPILIILNIGNKSATDDYTKVLSDFYIAGYSHLSPNLKNYGYVLYSVGNNNSYKEKQFLNLQNLTIHAGSGVVVQLGEIKNSCVLA